MEGDSFAGDPEGYGGGPKGRDALSLRALLGNLERGLSTGDL